MKVVINSCYGGFGLTDLAFEMLLDRKGTAWEKRENKYGCGYDYYHAGHMDEDEYYLSEYDFINNDRSDQDLVAVVEQLGNAANGRHAQLKIVDIPDDVKWHVEEYDGIEWIAEDHRTWE